MSTDVFWDEKIKRNTEIILSGKGTALARALAYYHRGISYNEIGDLDRAIADFNESLRISPTIPLVYCKRGRSFLAKGDLDSAIANFSEWIRLEPNYSDAFITRGRAYSERGFRALNYSQKLEQENGVADANKAVELAPGSADYLSRISFRCGPAISKRLQLFKRQELEPAIREAIDTVSRRERGAKDNPGEVKNRLISDRRISAAPRALQYCRTTIHLRRPICGQRFGLL